MECKEKWPHNCPFWLFSDLSDWHIGPKVILTNKGVTLSTAYVCSIGMSHSASVLLTRIDVEKYIIYLNEIHISDEYQIYFKSDIKSLNDELKD